MYAGLNCGAVRALRTHDDADANANRENCGDDGDLASDDSQQEREERGPEAGLAGGGSGDGSRHATWFGAFEGRGRFEGSDRTHVGLPYESSRVATKGGSPEEAARGPRIDSRTGAARGCYKEAEEKLETGGGGVEESGI